MLVLTHILIASLIAAGFSLFRIRRAILPILQSRFLWAPITLFLVILFNSGYMWNRIRDAPYMTKDRQGNSQWMTGGFQQQLGAETQVVGVICTSFLSVQVTFVRVDGD